MKEFNVIFGIALLMFYFASLIVGKEIIIAGMAGLTLMVFAKIDESNENKKK